MMFLKKKGDRASRSGGKRFAIVVGTPLFALVLSSSCRPVAGGDDLVAVEQTLTALGEVPLDAPRDLAFHNDRTSTLPIALPAGCVAIVARAETSTAAFDATVRSGDPNPASGEAPAIFVRSTRAAFVQVLRTCSDHPRAAVVELHAASGSGNARVRLWSDGRAVDRPVRDLGAFGHGTCGAPLPLEGGLQQGSTRGALATQAVVCADGGGPERVHEIVLREPRRVRLALSADFDAAIALRRICDDARTELACNDDLPLNNASASRNTRASSLNAVLPAGRYFVIVDGAEGESGDYTLSYTSERVADFAQRCRNAEVFGGSSQSSGDWSDGLASSTAPCGGHARGPELIRALPLDAPSRVRITLEADGPFTPVVHVRSRCEDAATTELCGLPALARSATIAGILPAGVHSVFLDSEEAEASGMVRATLETSPADGIGTYADTCDDAERIVVSGREIHAPGNTDTFLARDDDATSCTVKGGPEVYRSFTLTERSRVQVEKNQDEGDHRFALRRGDCVHPKEISCGTTIDAVLEPGTYTLVTEANGPEGIGRIDFTILSYPMAPREKACASAPVLPLNGKLKGSTAGAANLFGSSCAPDDGRGGSDRVYRFTVTKQGLLDIDLVSSFGAILSLREGCMIPINSALGTVERACAIEETPTAPTHLTTELQPGTYSLFVDGNAEGQSGTFSLTTQFSPGKRMEIRDYD